MSDEINAGTGPNIVLRDHDNVPVEHDFPTHLQVDAADGGTTKYVHESLVAEPVEATVELDFSGGDMTITPEKGQAFSEVSISVPTNLIPANIAEGVTIAGIPGALAPSAGGGKPNFFVKRVTIYSPAHNVHSGIITLATAEELAAAGFTGEEPAIIGYLPVSAGRVYVPNSNPCTMGAIMSSLTLGINSSYSYYRGYVFRGYYNSNRYYWTHTAVTENAFSGNPVDNVPYYAGGEIRYNWDSQNPITDRGMDDTTLSSRDILVFAGTLKPTIEDVSIA